MDLSGFYAIVSGINFTLLGLWWVAVQRERSDVGVDSPAGRRMAYLVSLQFVIPGTTALLSQIAPDVPALWRVSFTVAGLAGAVGSAMLADRVAHLPGQTAVVGLLRFLAVPVYALIAVVAAIPPLTAARGPLSPLQIEAILMCVLVFLGVQAAWVVAMAPRRD